MIVRLLVRSVLGFAITAALLFVPAGTIHWPGAWVLLALFTILSLTFSIWLAYRDPALLEERLGSVAQEGQPLGDKILLLLLLVLVVGWSVFMAFDAVRFGWSNVPVWVQVLGAIAVFAGLCISQWTLLENSFAAPVVKIQRERKQHVISTGPYRCVRHPMYAGAIILFTGVPLLLGSWWGLAWVPFLTALLGARILIEEKVLRSGLEGYDDYAARVPYRLIPLVW